ncbi:hypothetical protein BROUX41_002244 [Berkeleyomyces rouxiae]|uniref:uncharacterized protein n=1 Tax=Berkeleyomyces rouxiae TaxID=2035830 RepID=UPI003B8261DA
MSAESASLRSVAFDPYTQVFNLTASDGVTQFPVALDILNTAIKRYYAQCISYGVQFGLCFGLLLSLLILSPTERIRKIGVRLQMAGLLCNMLRVLLLALYYTSNWTELYDMASGEYLQVDDTDLFKTVSSTVMLLVLLALIGCMLTVHAWSLMRMWAPLAKWTALAISVGVTMALLSFKIVVAVMYTRATLRMEGASRRAQWLSFASNIMYAAVIFWFAMLFNVKLVTHLVKNRRFLPLRNRLTPIETLVITNGIMMIIPVSFASMSWADISHYLDVIPWMSTSTICVVAYGSLAAQRITNSTVSSLGHIESANISNNSRSNYVNIRNLGSMETQSQLITSRNANSVLSSGQKTLVGRRDTSSRMSPTKTDIEAGAVLVERDLDQHSEKHR